MISFPVLRRIDVSEYGLYPGTAADPGLHAEFDPGLTLVLGTNGLGKTTLINIVFRLLTGPYDIAGLVDTAELGSARLTPTKLSGTARKAFAQRVSDGAVRAKARVEIDLGGKRVTIERRLSDLTLTQFKVNGYAQPSDEQLFQSEIAKIAGVWSFGDWVLLLRQVIFYFEDRRALVWDPSAQRQILRMLLLAPERAQKWTEDEREILVDDSRMRNLSAAVAREENALASNETKVTSGLDVRQELRSLQEVQDIDVQRLADLEEEQLALQSERSDARLRLLRAEETFEARLRSLERAKLDAIAARFPTRSETARYIFAQLLTDEDCLVCGTHVPDVAADLSRRVRAHACVICGSDLTAITVGTTGARRRDSEARRSEKDFSAGEAELESSKRNFHETDRHYRSLVGEMAELQSSISERSMMIDALIRRLPPEEAELHQQRSELASLRARVAQLREQLETKRTTFGEFVADVMREIVAWSGEIKGAFEKYAEGFLLEDCFLTWAPQMARVGQSGDPIAFPAFGLEMTGSDYSAPVRRSGPEQVSESQREFIDLAFRMALISVAARGGAGTLVVDAPESSLDAVFSHRAADVLSRFASPKSKNRLLVTSNLVDGDLIPRLLEKAGGRRKKGAKVIDLLRIAAPTAAVRARRAEYETVRDRLLKGVLRRGTR